MRGTHSSEWDNNPYNRCAHFGERQRGFSFYLLLITFIMFLPAASIQIPASSAQAITECTWVVATNGDDTNNGSMEAPLKTIQKAIEVAQPGDEICVREGVYREHNLTFNHSGTSDRPITLRNFPEESPVLDGGVILGKWQSYSNDTFYTEDFDPNHSVTMVTEDERMMLYDHDALPDTLIPGGMLQAGNRIYVRPFAGTVEGHAFILPYQPIAIEFKSHSYIKIEGLAFKHYDGNTIHVDADSHHIQIHDCIFRNNVRTSLYLEGDYITVESCDIRWSGVFGILFTGKHSAARNCRADYVGNAYYATDDANDILFENCEATHFAQRGIPNTDFRGDGDAVGLGPSTDVVVRNGHFHDSGNDFPISGPEEQKGYVFDIWKAERFTIENNLVHDVHTAFTVAPGRNGLIQNNLIYNVEGNGISFWGSTENPGYNMKVYNNTIFNCADSGIHISPYTTSVQLVNNIIMNCGGYEYSVDEKDGNEEDYNLFYDSSTDYVVSWLGSAKTLAQYKVESGQGMNSLGEDPQFYDVVAKDFHLKENSPGIDAGLELPSVVTDMDGNTRPQGSAYDLGAFEYPSGNIQPTLEDVPLDHWAHDYIETLYQGGYIAGCSVDPMLYCPEDILTRAESAVFVERGIHGADFLPDQPAEQTFADVPLTEWFAKWTTALWNDGYTAGCGTNPFIYCPFQYHSRAEGCVFFLCMMYGSDYVPPEPTGLFADVPITAWYADWVEAAYNAGIIPACQTTPQLLFCPEDPLDRAMAAYMMVQAKGIQIP
jgi:hypothetical protein